MALLKLFTNRSDDATDLGALWTLEDASYEGVGMTVGHFTNWTLELQVMKRALPAASNDNSMTQRELNATLMDKIEEDYTMVTVEGHDHLQTKHTCSM